MPALQTIPMPGPRDAPDAGGNPRSTVASRLAVLGVFVAALVITAVVVRPLEAGPVSSDATTSVLYFERLAAGRQLEAFMNTTPKPLLTAVFGLAHAVSDDWRLVSATTIVIAAVAAALGAWLMGTVGGPVAGALAAVFLALNSSLLVEVAWSYGLPWALACWLAAGVALTRASPRYGLAGLALMLGALVRPETFTLIGAATAWLGWLAMRRRLPAGAPWLMTGWLAVPLMMAHDVLLAGDPLYWLHVSSINAEEVAGRSVGRVARALADRSLGTLPLLAAAAVGLAGALRSAPGRLVAGGIVAVAGGTAALLLLVGAMGRVVLGHYYFPIWVALGLAACLGVAFAVEAVAGWGERRVRQAGAGEPAVAGDRAMRLRGPMTVGLAAVLGLAVIGPSLMTAATVATVDRLRQLAANSDAAARDLAALLGDVPDPGPGPGASVRADPSAIRLLVPPTVHSRLAVDLGLPVTLVGALVTNRDTPGQFHRGQLVYHDPLAGRTSEITAPFEGASPATVEGVTFELVAATPDGTRTWRSGD